MAERARRGRDSSPDEVAARRSRRRFARRQWRRRWLRWKDLLAVTVILALVVGGTWLVAFSRFLAVQQVEVTGTELLTAADVRSAARVPAEQPLARVDVASIQRRVESLAPVASAVVTRKWPDSVAIDIAERQPIAVVEIGGRVRGMDREGVIFREYPQAPDSLPVVRTTPAAGEEALTEAARVVSALPAALARRVAYISVETVDQITLVLRDQRQVLWGSAEDSGSKAKVLVALLSTPAKTYDVSVPGVPTTSASLPAP